MLGRVVNSSQSNSRMALPHARTLLAERFTIVEAPVVPPIAAIAAGMLHRDEIRFYLTHLAAPNKGVFLSPMNHRPLENYRTCLAACQIIAYTETSLPSHQALSFTPNQGIFSLPWHIV